MLDELDKALDAAGLTDPRYAATVELARSYAALLDEVGVEELPKVGPLLLSALDKLGLTPAARGARKGGEPDAGKPANPLDELRARRDARTAS